MLFNFDGFNFGNDESNDNGEEWNFKDFIDKNLGKGKSKGSKKGAPWWQVLILTILIMFVYFFFALPSLSPQSEEFYFTIILSLIVYWVLHAVIGKPLKNYVSLQISVVVAILAILIPFVGSFIASPFFFSQQFASVIQVNTGVFEEDVEQANLDQVPVVDREAAQVIGQKELGAVGDLVSQFTISPRYSQVNIQGKPIRVSPLDYYDFIKYLSNFRNGIEYYVSIDMTSQDGDLVELEDPIFYSESDILLRDLDRHLRFQYPFYILGESNFEIDDEGRAWYVTPHLVKPVMFFGGLDAKGAILTDANTGESTYYLREDTPAWVDRVNPSEVIIQQLNDYGMYTNGFWNSLFSQRNVTQTTEGYNYISLGTDIYLTTGVTSVRADESNLGFYYVNLRTKEASFYPQPSATEYSAMSSARGKVQDMNYEPTFPVILNIGGRPVYFMSLKDHTLTAKQFALVDAEQFTNVIVGNTVDETMALYYEQNPEAISESDLGSLEETLTIEQVSAVVEEGFTVYYFTVEENDSIYKAIPADLGADVIFLQAGDEIRIISSTIEGATYNTIVRIGVE